SVVIAAGVALLLLQTPLGLSLSARLDSSIATLQGHGPVEGRLAYVWPDALGAVASHGTSAWLFGVPGGYDGPTDSQYLWMLVNVGIVGVMLFLSLHVYVAVRSALAYRAAGDTVAGKMHRALAAGIIAMSAVYVVHPALQGDRLLSAFIVTAV